MKHKFVPKNTIKTEFNIGREISMNIKQNMTSAFSPAILMHIQEYKKQENNLQKH